jgi:hypothetical protein
MSVLDVLLCSSLYSLEPNIFNGHYCNNHAVRQKCQVSSEKVIIAQRDSCNSSVSVNVCEAKT